MPRFFVSKKQIQNHIIIINNEDVKHIKVLRHKPGDIIEICDGECVDYRCRIDKIEKNEVMTSILEKVCSKTEAKVKVALFQALPKSDKMDLIVQKCVELGIYEIFPVITKNTTVKLKESHSKKIERWQKISETAAKQSGRGIIPKINDCIDFNIAISKLKDMDKSFIAYENEQNKSIKGIFNQLSVNNIGLFIGPEGGFCEEEIAFCIKEGIQPISLGRRILRTETAGFAALIMLLFEIGDM